MISVILFQSRQLWITRQAAVLGKYYCHACLHAGGLYLRHVRVQKSPSSQFTLSKVCNTHEGSSASGCRQSVPVSVLHGSSTTFPCSNQHALHRS